VAKVKTKRAKIFERKPPRVGKGYVGEKIRDNLRE